MGSCGDAMWGCHVGMHGSLLASRRLMQWGHGLGLGHDRGRRSEVGTVWGQAPVVCGGWVVAIYQTALSTTLGAVECEESV